MLRSIEAAWSLVQQSKELKKEMVDSKLRSLTFSQFAALAFSGLDLEVKRT